MNPTAPPGMEEYFRFHFVVLTGTQSPIEDTNIVQYYALVIRM